jgi:hypothetical protein
MKANRSRNLFDRKSNKPFKISRSKFEAFLKCKKCFYIDRIKAVNFPSSPPYTLNNLVDELLKKEFDSYRKDQKPHPVFKTINFNGVPYQHENLDKWRTSLTGGVEYLDEKNNLILSGGIDDVWLDKSTNSIVVVDYKATAKTNGVADDILEQEAENQEIMARVEVLSKFAQFAAEQLETAYPGQWTKEDQKKLAIILIQKAAEEEENE